MSGLENQTVLCGHLDYRNPYGLSRDDTNFVSQACLPSVLLLVLYSMFTIIFLILAFVSFYTMYISWKNKGRSSLLFLMSVCCFGSCSFAALLHITNLFSISEVLRYTSLALTLTLLNGTYSLLMYQWLAVTTKVESFSKWKDEISVSLKTLKTLFIVYNLVNTIVYLALLVPAGVYRTTSVKITNQLTFTFYLFFCFFTAAVFIFISSWVFYKLNVLFQEGATEQVKEIVTKMKKIAGAIFLMSINVTSTGFGLIIWYALTYDEGYAMDYFFFLLFFMFVPSQSITSSVIIWIIRGQALNFDRSSRGGYSNDTEKSAPLKPIV